MRGPPNATHEITRGRYPLLRSVRRWGGVLEHPAGSLAWPRYGLVHPVRGRWSQCGSDWEWVTEVSQSAYGHPARKRTWLYYFGFREPHALNWCEPATSARVSYCANHGSREASATPPAFLDTLIRLAMRAR